MRSDEILMDEVRSSFLSPGKGLLSLYEISELIRTQHGDQLAEDFIEVQLEDTSPKYPEHLKAFFRGRTDLISEDICRRLT